VLVLGRISDDPKAHYEQLQPLLDYVVARMHDVGIQEGRILMARDPQQMASYLRRGRVDWVTETSGTAVALGQRSGARPLLLTERNGVREYQTVFFVRSDSPIQRVQDLRGHRLALQNTASTSAYLVPVMTLLHHGLSPQILAGSGTCRAGQRGVCVRAQRVEHRDVRAQGDGGCGGGEQRGLERRAAGAGGIPARFPRTAAHRTLPACGGDGPRRPRSRVRDRLQEVLLQAASDPQAQGRCIGFWHFRFPPRRCACAAAVG
jgi:phosphonate transport system substrate-binding protein